MIIFNINDGIEDTKGYFKRLFKGRSNEISRDYEIINSIPFDIITLTYDDIKCEKIEHLLTINNGKILESTDMKLNQLIGDYLFDKTPYIKRTLLSSVNDFIEQSGDRVSVLVIDNDFSESREYYDLCNNSKSFTIITDGLVDECFLEEIYYNLGLKVNVKDNFISSQYDMVIDFSQLKNNNCFYIQYLGENIPIYPSSVFFEPDEYVFKLMNLGVPIKCACAVLRG